MIFPRILALLALTTAGAVAQSGFYLKDGDRVVFYGDSITDQRLYTAFTETFAVTRFPDEHFTFVHSGWGGDRVNGGGGGAIDLRLNRDVFPYKPTVVTIMLGMNDAYYKPFDSSVLNTYERGYEYILDSIQGKLPGVRITVIQPSPYDDVTRPPLFDGGYNAVLLHYAKFVKDVAESIHVDSADLNTPVVAMLKKANDKDAAVAKTIITDRVHPGPGGHMIMAEALLKAWRAPALVSNVELNAKTSKVDRANNATVTNWNGTGWTATEKVLPMPIAWKDGPTALAIQSSDFLEALDQETLQVTGLKPGTWQLKIDDAAVASFRSDELAHGINLARYNTPMMMQALDVHRLTVEHNDVHFVRWRNLQVPLLEDDLSQKADVLTALDRLEEAIVLKQHKAAQPLPHKFELVAQP